MEPKTQEITHDESQSSSAAAQKVASVDDLLIEIFLRLPVKPLIRFKSVSKNWQSLISDPGFAIRHNQNPNPATGLIFLGPKQNPIGPRANFYAKASNMAQYIISLNDSTPRIRTLKLNPWPYDTTTINSSSNGLLLCRIFNFRDSNPRKCRYCVFNPTTNKNLTLPQTHYESKVIELSMCLAFDPSKSPHYKVVCALRSLETEGIRYKFMVYSSETGCWRKSCVQPFEDPKVNFQGGVYWNGAMHWVSQTKTGKSIYFDPDDDRMSLEIMPTPPVTDYNPWPCVKTYYFGESCGHLYYTDCCTWLMTELVVYELRSDYSEWFVKYRIHDPNYSIGGPMPYLYAVIQGKSHEDTFSVFVTKKRNLLRYNFLNKTLETICEGPLVFLELPIQHAESLCSV